MEKDKETKTIKISLWMFYVLVAGMVILLATTIIGWLLVAKQNIDKKETVPSTSSIVRVVK